MVHIVFCGLVNMLLFDNLEVRWQSEDRAHRHGQTGQVTIIDIIARDTIDEMVLHSLENKIELSAKTLGEQVQKWL